VIIFVVDVKVGQSDSTVSVLPRSQVRVVKPLCFVGHSDVSNAAVVVECHRTGRSASVQTVRCGAENDDEDGEEAYGEEG
jgi:hypothetical protein